MKVVVCSLNVSKNEAVKNVLSEYLEDLEFESIETNSLVSETPISDDEGLLGCFNRINDAKGKVVDSNFYVAMEGILSSNNYGTFLCGWTVIYNRLDDEYYYGCSSKIRIPDYIMKDMNKDIRLSDVVAKYFNSTDYEISKIGTNGVLTNGSYTRVDEFMDSIRCAISSKYKKL